MTAAVPSDPRRELIALTELTLARIPGDRRGNLHCPHHGAVAWARLPFDEARELVAAATQKRVERRGLDRPPYISKSEVWLVAGLLYYQCDTFQLQHPVGPWDLDVYFPADNVCVEVDGDILHNRARDRRRDRDLAQRGIRTVRLNGRHVTSDPLWAARKAALAIAEKRRASR